MKKASAPQPSDAQGLRPSVALHAAELPGHERRGHQRQDQEERCLHNPAEEAEAEDRTEEHAVARPAERIAQVRSGEGLGLADDLGAGRRR